MNKTLDFLSTLYEKFKTETPSENKKDHGPFLMHEFGTDYRTDTGNGKRELSQSLI